MVIMYESVIKIKDNLLYENILICISKYVSFLIKTVN